MPRNEEIVTKIIEVDGVEWTLFRADEMIPNEADEPTAEEVESAVDCHIIKIDGVEYIAMPSAEVVIGE